MQLPYMDTTLVVLSAFVIFMLVSSGALLILWIAVPFSVFGVKGLLRKVIEEQEKTNMLLSGLVRDRRDRPMEGPAENRDSAIRPEDKAED